MIIIWAKKIIVAAESYMSRWSAYCGVFCDTPKSWITQRSTLWNLIDFMWVLINDSINLWNWMLKIWNGATQIALQMSLQHQQNVNWKKEAIEHFLAETRSSCWFVWTTIVGCAVSPQLRTHKRAITESVERDHVDRWSTARRYVTDSAYISFYRLTICMSNN